jgi:hypothetical protein
VISAPNDCSQGPDAGPTIRGTRLMSTRLSRVCHALNSWSPGWQFLLWPHGSRRTLICFRRCRRAPKAVPSSSSCLSASFVPGYSILQSYTASRPAATPVPTGTIASLSLNMPAEARRSNVFGLLNAQDVSPFNS